jgi:hypothetical protein
MSNKKRKTLKKIDQKEVDNREFQMLSTHGDPYDPDYAALGESSSQQQYYNPYLSFDNLPYRVDNEVNLLNEFDLNNNENLARNYVSIVNDNLNEAEGNEMLPDRRRSKRLNKKGGKKNKSKQKKKSGIKKRKSKKIRRKI